MATETEQKFEEEYREVLSLIRRQRKGSNIDKIILDFLKKQIKEIKEGKRSELDIGDVFGIAIQDALIHGYKLSKDVEDLSCDLGGYKIEQAPSELENIKDVEREVNKLILKRVKRNERMFNKNVI